MHIEHISALKTESTNNHYNYISAQKNTSFNTLPAHAITNKTISAMKLWTLITIHRNLTKATGSYNHPPLFH